MKSWQVGVDEVGRGPLAGPVAVGVVRTPGSFCFAQKLPGVTDSKKLTEMKREEIYKQAYQLRRQGELNWSIAMMPAGQIDRKGIQWAIRAALARGLGRVQALPNDHLLLDGGLYAPEHFLHQTTIIKGDVKEETIGLASIVAKVTRDRYMTARGHLAAYAQYDFATHKGYGTKAHRAAIAKYGLSPEHRVSYCKNITLL